MKGIAIYAAAWEPPWGQGWRIDGVGEKVGLFNIFCQTCFIGGADKSFARPGRKQATATEDFSYTLFMIIIGGILILFIRIYIYIYIYIYKTILASNEIF